MKTCKDCRTHLPDLLLDEAFASAHPDYAAHLASCAECRTELAELRATFALLDDWSVPEVSPYFDTRLQARLREAVAAPAEGFWERTRSFLLYSTGRQFRPAVATAMAFVVMLGGALPFVIGPHPDHAPTAASATVNDLRILDNNSPALQQMDQLLDDSTTAADDSGAPPTT